MSSGKSFSQRQREFVPVSILDQDVGQPREHVVLNSSIVVAGGSLLSELFVLMYEHIGKDLRQDLCLARVSASLVDLVNMSKPTTAQELEKLTEERIGDEASEEGRVVERV